MDNNLPTELSIVMPCLNEETTVGICIRKAQAALKEMGVLGKSFKINYCWLLPCFIFILGFYLRVYHINYPVIGYHNWKEIHFLTEARNFARDGFFKHGFFIPAHDYPQLYFYPSGVHGDTFPIISVIVAIFFKIFGIKLLVARMINLSFGVAAIPLTYFATKKLFNRENLALISAFITAICPLYVFFSHNTQLMNPGLCFMLASLYFYFGWVENNDAKYLILTSLFLTLAALTNYHFLVIAIPMLTVFPFKRLLAWKKHITEYLISIFTLLLVPAWVIYTESLNLEETIFKQQIHLNLGLIFTSRLWQMLRMYAIDNYTLLGVFFAAIGLLSLFISYKDNNFGSKFILGYFAGFIVFLFVMANKLIDHSYHQYPIAYLIIFLIAYSFVTISDKVIVIIYGSSESELIRKLKGLISTFALILLSLIILLPSLRARNRQFDTQFLGLDIAGEYIKRHSRPNERIFFPSHQSFGILWHADRKGIPDIPNLEGIKYAEKNLNGKWMFIYQWGMKVCQNKEIWDYIKNTYSLKQVAFQRQHHLIYFLFKKGGSFDEGKLDDIIQNKVVHTREYEFTKGRIPVYYINIE